jgi:HAD superfamily hydrolase (TIGR01662 family)
MVKTRAVFFDRDGVLTNLVDRGCGIKTAPWILDELTFSEFAKTAIKVIQFLGYNPYIVSNQPDFFQNIIPTTKIDQKIWDLVNEMECKVSAELEIPYENIFHCYDRTSEYYKPGNKAIENFIKAFDIDRDKSFFIGDSWKDIAAGNASGLTTIFIGDYHYQEYQHDIDVFPDHQVMNLSDAISIIIEKGNLN